MSGRKAIFRCDASSTIGSGHVMRCLTLSEYMRERGWDCIFSVSQGTEEAVPMLSKSAFPVVGPDGPFPSDRADIIVIDSYALSAPDEKKYRSIANKIVVIDDLADRPHDCDMLLDQTYARKPDSYSRLVPPDCIILTGTDYALLRPQFLQERGNALRRRQEMNGKIDRLLVSMGGTDPHNILPVILRGAQDSGLAIDVMIGSGALYLDELKSVINALRSGGTDISLHLDSNDVAGLMSRADLAIGAGGTTSWERCCLALPTILVVVADNQKTIAKNLADAGAVYNLGWYEDINEEIINAAIIEFINHPEKLIHTSHKAAVVCSGRGLDCLYPYLFEAEENVALMHMQESDEKILFDWQKHPETRRYARNPAPPTWDGHQKWFKSVLNDSNRYLYKIMLEGMAVGMLRLDRVAEYSERKFEVSILLDPRFYGRGIAGYALAFARKLDPFATYMAEVHEANIASRRLFEKAGYRPISATWFEHKRG